MSPNPILAVDAYTGSSDDFASKECRERSIYNFSNRYSPVKAFPALAKDSRMVFFGLTRALKFLSQRITTDNVREAKAFYARANSFGGGLPFNEDMWNEVVRMGGYLPLEISAIPEGTIFFPNETPLQVHNTISGFGELAAHIEARLVGTISVGTACATMCRHWLERMKDEVRTDLRMLNRNFTEEDVMNIAQWQIHNFGMRATTSEEESTLMGMAHLLSFNGTDNWDAAAQAWREGCDELTGTSIRALAHRNVQGHDTEEAAFQAIIDSTKGDVFRIASLVGDCYSYNDAVSIIMRLARENEDVCLVGRPDSGKCLDVLMELFYQAIANNVVKTDNNWFIPKNARYIYGDSVKPEHQFETMARLRERGMLPTLWGIWGVGGYIRNTPTRDSLSSAFKLSARGDSGEPVVKLSETDSKLSIPFQTRMYRSDTMGGPTIFPVNEEVANMQQINRVVYRNGVINYGETFKVVKKRALKQFNSHDEFAKQNPDFGLNRETLSESIRKVQNDFAVKYRKPEQPIESHAKRMSDALIARNKVS